MPETRSSCPVKFRREWRLLGLWVGQKTRSATAVPSRAAPRWSLTWAESGSQAAQGRSPRFMEGSWSVELIGARCALHARGRKAVSLPCFSYPPGTTDAPGVDRLPPATPRRADLSLNRCPAVLPASHAAASL